MIGQSPPQCAGLPGCVGDRRAGTTPIRVNVGMTDLVAALRWVRDNIANFGGDPDRVMIYGQSGGGSKVTTLLGMPSAEGLIHRASAQSGGGGNPPERRAVEGATPSEVMAELGGQGHRRTAERWNGPS